MTSVSTPEGINYYRLAVLKQALKAIKIGMRVNSAYTPKNVKAAVEKETGKKFRARDYDGMLGSVEELMERLLKELKEKEQQPSNVS